MVVKIRKVEPTDWEAVKFIYEEGIRTGIATFETTVPDNFEVWFKQACPHSVLVAEDEQVVGWCKLSPVSDRKVYEGVGEVSIYVHPDARGKGVGAFLLNELISLSESLGFWTMQSSIFPENKASIELHLKVGFREVGIRKCIGKLNNQWRDNLLLERRSENIGK